MLLLDISNVLIVEQIPLALPNFVHDFVLLLKSCPITS